MKLSEVLKEDWPEKKDKNKLDKYSDQAITAEGYNEAQKECTDAAIKMLECLINKAVKMEGLGHTYRYINLSDLEEIIQQLREGK